MHQHWLTTSSSKHSRFFLGLGTYLFGKVPQQAMNPELAAYDSRALTTTLRTIVEKLRESVILM